MRNKFLIWSAAMSTFCILSSLSMHAQSFTQNNSLIPATYNSGGCTAVCDMNNDGLDDIVILDNSRDLSIAYQLPGGAFSVSSFGAVSGQSQWGMCVGDVDNDGHKDIMCGGSYDDVHVVNINSSSDYALVDYSWASIFMQGCNLVDINNDGFLDGFACHDDGHNVILLNDGSGQFTNGTSLMDMVFYPETGGNDNSGNYGSVWSDFDRDGDTDLFIAKCRQFVNDPYDPRRTNILVINNGDGTFDHTNPVTGISYAQERGLVNLEQSWTSDFADLDNDGDFDCFLTTHSNTLEIYENDGNGFFTDRTAGSGLQYSGFFLQGKFHDLDNDGFLDLIHAGGSHDYYRNDGDFTFTRIQNTFVNNDVMHSFGIGDLNHDGWLDLYASYGNGYVDPDNSNPDRIFINNGGSNNWVAFDLAGIASNQDAVGAIVEITGSFGTQVREVRAGESYGITNTSTCHFGIGSANSITEAHIYWPDGLETVLSNPAINTFHSIAQSPCFLAEPVISAAGPTEFCAGESVVLQATNNSLDYVWNNGSTGSSITVSEPGNYYATATSALGCIALTNSIPVVLGNTPTASILSQSIVESCSGEPITLTASSGSNYSWSNGATGQSVILNSSGSFTVTITSSCGQATSEPVLVNFINPPSTLGILDATVSLNSSATLSNTGIENTNWYANANDITPLATGSTFTTPALSQTTSYWAETFNTGEINNETGGKLDWTLNGEGQYQPNSTYYLIFDAHRDFILQTVKVYSNSAGIRYIYVVDEAGNTIVDGQFDIPNGESVVPLNFFIPEGQGYGLRLGFTSDLWRDKSTTAPFAYPFQIGNLATITNTNVSGADTDNYYYYFYDWHAETPVTLCYSDRIEVVAEVTSQQFIEGCTDPAACNFDPTATLENGLCTYPGCNDPLACNFNPLAGCNDGSCINDNPNTPILWEDDFSNPSTWIIDHDGAFNSDFEIGVGLVSNGAYGTPAIESATASNGYALYNSDGYNNQAGVAYEQPHITTAFPINCSGYTNLILEFQTQYRSFTDEQTWLIVSTDGTFPTLDDPLMDISGMPGVYRVWEDGELTQSVSPGNPTTRQFNISEIAGNAPQVWVRFQFTGIWGYAWYIDDVIIREQLPYDANLENNRLTYSPNNAQFARIPVTQIPQTFQMKGTVVNDGFNPLSNLELSINITNTETGAVVYNQEVEQITALLAESAITYDETISIPSALAEGMYTATISALHNACDGNMENNTHTHYFEVTEATYSVDGIGIYPAGTNITTSLGTNSFTDNADEITLMTYYEITEAEQAFGIEIALTSTSAAGGFVYVMLLDTLDVFSDIVFDPILYSDYYTLTEADISNGVVFIPFDNPGLLQPNGYYAAVSLYSSDNSNDIRILDDITVAQDQSISLLYLPSDGVVYQNGNAYAIRLLFESNIQIFGCTDPSACNYNPSANNENGSCTYPGCTDFFACNYEPTAGCNNGTCSYPGCLDVNACNYDFTAGCDDGSCVITNTPCNDGNPNTYGDIINSNCFCAGTPFNYGTVLSPDNSYCPGETSSPLQCSTPFNIPNYTAQWYYVDGNVSCPSGTSLAGWNPIAGANSLSYSPMVFNGSRTFACFITPVALNLQPSWANGCVTNTYYNFNSQAIVGNPNVTPFSSYTYAVNPVSGNSYTWNVTNGAITSGQETNAIQVLWGQNGPYQISLTESNGICESTSILLVSNANCSISVNAFAQNGTTFCSGEEAVLQTTTDAVSPVYQWYFNGQEIPSSNVSSLTISEPGTYQVMITVDACTAVSQTLSMSQYQALNTPLIEVSTSGEGCLTSGAQLSLNTLDFESIEWSTGATSDQITVTSSGTYSATITDVNGCFSSSLPIDINLALEPSVPICLVTVNESNNNQIIWEPLLSEVTSEYRIYKEGTVAEQYELIGSVPYGQDGIFTDALSNASVQASRYKLAILDSCGIESFPTPLHKTIHLTSNIGVNNTVNLIWSHYEGFGFGTYTIYRGDAPGNLSTLTSIASNLNSYTDNSPLPGTAYYVIEIEGVSCDPTRELVFSRSNTIELNASAILETGTARFQLYPNPTSDKFNLLVTQDLLDASIKVHNMVGQVMVETIITQLQSEFNTASWAPGVYSIEIQKENMRMNTLLIKQ